MRPGRKALRRKLILRLNSSRSRKIPPGWQAPEAADPRKTAIAHQEWQQADEEPEFHHGEAEDFVPQNHAGGELGDSQGKGQPAKSM